MLNNISCKSRLFALFILLINNFIFIYDTICFFYGLAIKNEKARKCHLPDCFRAACGSARSNQALYTLYTRWRPAWKRVKGG
jgi:hypothetical protein